MKSLFIIAVIAGLVILCGVGNLPCFADTGSGVSIELTTTVTGGSSGSGSGWSGGGYTNWQYVDNQPRKVSPYVPPPVTNSYPPTLPTYPTVTQTTPSPTVNPPAISSPAIDWGFVLVIAVLAGAIALLVYLVIRMRRRVVNPIDS